MIFMLKNSSYTLFSFGCHSDLWYSVILIDIWTKLSVGVCISFHSILHVFLQLLSTWAPLHR